MPRPLYGRHPDSDGGEGSTGENAARYLAAQGVPDQEIMRNGWLHQRPNGRRSAQPSVRIANDNDDGYYAGPDAETVVLPPRQQGESFADYTRRIGREGNRITPNVDENLGPVSLGRQELRDNRSSIHASLVIKDIEKLKGTPFTLEFLVDERGVLHLARLPVPEDLPREARVVISMPEE